MPRLQVWDTVMDAYGHVFGSPTGFMQKSVRPAMSFVASYTLFRLALNVMQRFQIAAKAASEAAAANMPTGDMPPPPPMPGGPGGPPHFPLMHILHQVLPVLPVVVFFVLMLFAGLGICATLMRHMLNRPDVPQRIWHFRDGCVWRMLVAILLFVIFLAVCEGALFGYSYLLQMAGGGEHATLGPDLFLAGKIIMAFGGIYIFLRGLWLLIPTIAAEGRVLAVRSWSLGKGKFPEFFLVLLMIVLPMVIARSLVHSVVGVAMDTTKDVNAILYAPSVLNGLLSFPGLRLVAEYVCGGVYVLLLMLLLVRAQFCCYLACRSQKDGADPDPGRDTSADRSSPSLTA